MYSREQINNMKKLWSNWVGTTMVVLVTNVVWLFLRDMIKSHYPVWVQWMNVFFYMVWGVGFLCLVALLLLSVNDYKINKLGRTSK